MRYRKDFSLEIYLQDIFLYCMYISWDWQTYASGWCQKNNFGEWVKFLVSFHKSFVFLHWKFFLPIHKAVLIYLWSTKFWYRLALICDKFVVPCSIFFLLCLNFSRDFGLMMTGRKICRLGLGGVFLAFRKIADFFLGGSWPEAMRKK